MSDLRISAKKMLVLEIVRAVLKDDAMPAGYASDAAWFMMSTISESISEDNQLSMRLRVSLRGTREWIEAEVTLERDEDDLWNKGTCYISLPFVDEDKCWKFTSSLEDHKVAVKAHGEQIGS